MVDREDFNAEVDAIALYCAMMGAGQFFFRLMKQETWAFANKAPCKIYNNTGADLRGCGGGGAVRTPSLRDSTPCRPKSSPLWCFLRNPFGQTQFFGQNFPKNAFFGLFFQNSACGAEILAKTGTKMCVRRAGKINSVDLKDGRQNFRNFFENPPPPPRENPRSAPVVIYKYSRMLHK